MTRNSRPYYTLVGFRNSDRRAEVLFGDYSKANVKAEEDTEQYSNGSTTHRRSDRYYHSFKIIVSDASQASIDDAVRQAETRFQTQFEGLELKQEG